MVVVVSAAGWVREAQSGPITFNSAIGLAEDEFVLREQYVLNRSDDDLSGTDRERTSQAVISVLGYALTGTDKLTFKSIQILQHISIKQILPVPKTQRHAVVVTDNTRLRLGVDPG